MKRLMIILLLVNASLWGQAYTDARGVGLCGAYTVASRGIHAVGYNPANLGFTEDVKVSINLAAMNLQAYNNFLSLSLFNQYFTGDANGDPFPLENRKPGTTQTHKEYLLSQIPNEGVTLGLATSIPFPGLNASFGNYALTSGLDIYSRILIPRGVFRLPLQGNPAYETFDFGMGLDMLFISHFDFSFAIPFETFNMGITVKYLAGLGYAGVDSSGGGLTTEPEGLVVDGFYRVSRALGGNGFGLDVGMTTQRINNWQLGVSINNAIGFMHWGNDQNFINKNIRFIEAVLPIRKYLQIPTDTTVFGARTIYSYVGDTTNVVQLLAGDQLFSNEQEEQPTADSIRMNYPAVVRVGAAWYLPEDLTLYADLSTGLDDYYYASRKWRLAVATEWNRFKRFPIRSGMAFGGYYGREASLGTGFRLLWIDANLSVRFLGGMSLTKAEGIEVGLGVTFLN